MSDITCAISRGNIRRTVFDPGNQIPLYLGSGDSGAVFDAYGLIGYMATQAHDDFGTFKHLDYYARGSHNVDSWLSLFKIKAGGHHFQEIPTDYFQELNLVNGQLTTSFTLGEVHLKSRVYFHPYHRDILTYELEGPWQIFLEPVSTAGISYGNAQGYRPVVEGTEDGFAATTNQCRVHVMLKTITTSGSCSISHENAMPILTCTENTRCTLLIATCREERQSAVRGELDAIGSPGVWRRDAEDSWRRRWGDAYLDLTDDQCQADWARSAYYVLCSFSPNGIPSAPMGWSGAAWRFHFPQDVSYIHPALLRLGHLDLAKRIPEFYLGRLEQARAITRRVYGGDGCMWPWEYPIGLGDQLHMPDAPNRYQFEIHNAAYPARMAYETSLFLHDPSWTRDVALPIIQASADFYASHLVQEENHTYSLDVKPSMSQDEFAEPNSRNYLCSLYSARYVFTIAVKMGLAKYEPYLKAGLAFERLIDQEHRIYNVAECMRLKNFGIEKHPVQLNPLVFLPNPVLNEYEENAYRLRYDICSATKQHVFHGWTLAVFWLASSHLGHGEDLLRELKLADKVYYRDKEFIQFRESTGTPDVNPTAKAYYVTTHGLYLQAVQDAFLCDSFGDLRINAAVPEAWKGSQAVNLRSHLRS